MGSGKQMHKQAAKQRKQKGNSQGEQKRGQRWGWPKLYPCWPEGAQTSRDNKPQGNCPQGGGHQGSSKRPSFSSDSEIEKTQAQPYTDLAMVPSRKAEGLGRGRR